MAIGMIMIGRVVKISERLPSGPETILLFAG
jgi:hypothetical protein